MGDEMAVAGPAPLAARISRRLAELGCEPELLGNGDELPLWYVATVGMQRLVIQINSIGTLRSSVLESDERLWAALAVWVVGYRADVGTYLQPTGCYLSQVLDVCRVLGLARALESTDYTVGSEAVRAQLV